ncbi:MAG: Uma2 family endonuclease [Terriglobia bacterium]|jgi:Uma2 family endonuclease
MGNVLTLPEQRVVLEDVSWGTYEHLLSDHLEKSVPRFTFDRGRLEIMSPSSEHEEYKQALTMLVVMLADGLGIDIRNLGSTTFKRSELERGFEADVCFYVQSAARMHGKIHIDPAVDPAPDLVIEVEVTAPALNKLPIYAEFHVPKIWRYDGARLVVLHLSGNEYFESSKSLAFPQASAHDISRLVRQGVSLKSTEWLTELRNWVRELK